MGIRKWTKDMKRRLTEEDGHVAHSPWGGVRHHAPSGKRRLNHSELGTLPSERRKPAAGDSPGRWRGAGTLGPQHAATPRWGAGGAEQAVRPRGTPVWQFPDR